MSVNYLSKTLLLLNCYSFTTIHVGTVWQYNHLRIHEVKVSLTLFNFKSLPVQGHITSSVFYHTPLYLVQAFQSLIKSLVINNAL
jgi:hypothetical protein